jgi:hypothetical protein
VSIFIISMSVTEPNDQPASLRNHILLLEGPIPEDTMSAVPDISRFAAFIAHAQTDRPRDCHLS